MTDNHPYYSQAEWEAGGRERLNDKHPRVKSYSDREWVLDSGEVIVKDGWPAAAASAPDGPPPAGRALHGRRRPFATALFVLAGGMAGGGIATLLKGWL